MTKVSGSGGVIEIVVLENGTINNQIIPYTPPNSGK
jgi:hypothetical protein